MSYDVGRIINFKLKTFPINLMNATWLDAGVRRIARASITSYQKYISPHKGFACAHRLLYEGESCSQYVKRMVAEKDLLAAIKVSKQRFQACKEANRILRASIEQTEPEKSTKPKKNGLSCLEDPSICFSGWDCSSCQCGAEEINCSNCSVFESSSCEILNYGGCASGIGCSSLDCGSCSFL